MTDREKNITEVWDVKVIKVTEKGRVTIPKRSRDKHGIEDFVLVEDVEEGVLMRPVPKISEERGSLSHLFEEGTREILEKERREDRERERRLERI